MTAAYTGLPSPVVTVSCTEHGPTPPSITGISCANCVADADELEADCCFGRAWLVPAIAVMTTSKVIARDVRESWLMISSRLYRTVGIAQAGPTHIYSKTMGG